MSSRVIDARSVLVTADAHASPARAGRVSLIDFMIGAGLAAATLAIALYFAPRGFHHGFVDMGHDGYQLRQVLDLSGGGVIFKDTFDQYGPLNGYLNRVGFLTLGRRLLAMKYFMAGWYALIAVALFAMARRWLTPALAAFSTIVWLGLAPFYQHGIMISPHVYALFFQTVATIAVLRASSLQPRRFALAGVLTGLSWAVKQSMGTLFFAAILLYLVLRPMMERDQWSRVTKATAAVTAGFVSVIAVLLGLLWTQGAIGDWYLQTVAFPREFYLQNADRLGAAHLPGVLSHLVPPLAAKFVELQLAQPLYWVVIRLVVLVAAMVQVVRRRPADDLLLMASITAFLWLGAFPSSNFMHQWWTTSLTIAPFIVCVRKSLTRLASGDRKVAWITVALSSVIVGKGVIDRVNAAVSTERTLTETMIEPPLFRGIRTDETTKRVFETSYRLMALYRSHYPGTKVVSIESADGWMTGMVESLPFLSFFDGNTHSQAVYWNLPVLSTTTYPRYFETLWREVGAERPMIVEHHNGRYVPAGIPGYRVLMAAESDYGYWYVYAPDRADRAVPGEASIFLASDGATESGFAELGTAPKLAQRLNQNVEGAWRGRVLQPARGGGAIELPGTFPLVLLDRDVPSGAGAVNMYTWPADLPVANLDRPIEPVSGDPVWRAGRGDIVRELRPGAWTVDGQAQSPFAYLLQFRDEPVASGAYFVVRGELFEGGLQVGFLEQNRWSAFVAVTHEGLFEAVLQMQKPGRYGLVVANCIVSSWWERASRHWIGGTPSLFTAGFLPNHFRVFQAGWIQPGP
jgi:hypothetical protein